MTDENRRENMRDELGRGDRSLSAAKVLVEAGIWEDAVSCAYYAAFHFVRALLLTEGLQARSHAGVHDLLYVHFVKTARLPRRIHTLATDLQRRREVADYATPRLDEEAGRRALSEANEVRDAALAYLADGGWL